MRGVLLAAIALVLVGCSRGPEPIAFGRDQCAYCRMTIADARFGAALLTRQGRTYKFDSIECLAAFVVGGKLPAGHVHALWVSDHAEPGHLLPAETALFLRSPALRSPMGLNLGAFAGPAELERARGIYKGEELDWQGVRNLVQRAGLLERRAPGPAEGR